MIESCYWKEDLLNHAKRLRPISNPPRWSERRVVNFEKELIISFFCIRKLFESNKVSSASREYRANIYWCPSTGHRITKLNQHSIDDIYDLEKEKRGNKSVIFLCNQLIHSCTAFAYRNETRNWAGIYTCSDFERNRRIYRVPIEEIINIFKLVGSDFPSRFEMLWNEETEDYDVSTN